MGPRGIKGWGAREFGKKFDQWAVRSGGTRETGRTDQEATAREGEITREITTGASEVDWELLLELLDGGQGKILIEPTTAGTRPDGEGGTTGEGEGGEIHEQGKAQPTGDRWEVPPGLPPQGSPWAGLQPPVLKSTGNGVTGKRKGRFDARRQGNARPHSHRNGQQPSGRAIWERSCRLSRRVWKRAYIGGVCALVDWRYTTRPQLYYGNGLCLDAQQ